MGMLWILTASMSIPWLWYWTTVLQEVTIRGNWIKGHRFSLCSISFFLFFFFLKGIPFIFIIYLFIYLFLAVLGLRFCARAFSSCGKRGPFFIVVHGPLTITASLVAEHRLQTRRLSSCGSWALELRLSNCGSRAQLLRGMWDLHQTRARTRVPCISRWILNHCATREAP